MEICNYIPFCTAFDSPKVFREKHQDLFKLLESDCFVDGIPFYDFSHTGVEDNEGLFGNVSKTTAQLINSHNFVEAFSHLFIRHYTGEIGSPKETELAAEAILTKAYEKYVSNINSSIPNIDTTRRNELLTQWIDATSVLIWDALFCKGYFSIDKSNCIQSNLPLLKYVSNTLRRIKDDLLYDIPISKDKYEIVYYNIWGNSYVNDMLSLQQLDFEEQLTEDCRCKIKLWENKALLRNYLDEMIPKTISLSTKFDSELAMKSLERLFLDFVRRLRIFDITQAGKMIPAINGWVAFTIDELRAILLRDKINVVYSFGVEDPNRFYDISKKQIDGCCPLKDFRNIEIPIIDYQFLQNEKMFIDDCISKIHGCANVYIEKLQQGRKFYPWTDSLKALNINYDYLYKRMRSIGEENIKSVHRYTNTDSITYTAFHILTIDITYSIFKNCFYEADFSTIMESANRSVEIHKKKSGGPGCVRRLIYEVAQRLDNKEWKYKAAESVEHKGDGQTSYETLAKKLESKIGEKFQEEVLNVCLPKYMAK